MLPADWLRPQQRQHQQQAFSHGQLQRAGVLRPGGSMAAATCQQNATVHAQHPPAAEQAQMTRLRCRLQHHARPPGHGQPGGKAAPLPPTPPTPISSTATARPAAARPQPRQQQQHTDGATAPVQQHPATPATPCRTPCARGALDPASPPRYSPSSSRMKMASNSSISRQPVGDIVRALCRYATVHSNSFSRTTCNQPLCVPSQPAAGPAGRS